MKSFKLLLSVLALAALAAAPALRAQDAPAATPPASAPAKHKQHQDMDPAMRLKMMTKQLSLTADQQAKIGPILQDEKKRERCPQCRHHGDG